ncbi:adenine-specific DNA modification methylase [Prevotella sp. CAG:873]|nr:adenine-specific DNA modification methylase [Prevotella sp. CAG:873]
MANEDLRTAQSGKNDEFYTQYHDIEVEMNAYLEYNPDVFKDKTLLLPCDDPEWSNFTRYFAAKFDSLGLKRLISTSYAPESKKMILGGLFSEYEQSSPQFDVDKSKTHGKIYVLDSDITGDGHIDIDDLQWKYLDGDGDFRSAEVTALRNQADIIITNPPFSLFREFLAWITEADKQFIIIGNINAITYKYTFPLIITNKMWLGLTIHSGDREFEVPQEYPLNASKCRVDKSGRKFIRVKGVRWFTNIDHGRRHEPLALMTMADNLRYTKHKELKGKAEYDHYDNYDAIEVPFTDAIPSDYDGVMGVPVTWLDKYCPEQFEIVGLTSGRDEFIARPTKKYIRPMQVNKNGSLTNGSKANTRSTILMKGTPNGIYYTADNADGPLQIVFPRILIRKRK